MKGKRGKLRQPKKEAFIAAYAKCGNLSRAAEIAGCHRNQHYRWLEEPGYREAFDEAHEMACDALEDEARRRAYIGVDEPVYQGGKLVGKVKKFSDTLLIFLMKGNRPEKYRDNVKVTADVKQEVTQKTWVPPEDLLTGATADFKRFMANRISSNGHHETNGHVDRN